MKLIASELNQIIGEYSVRMNTLTELVCSHKPSPFKWSKKELIGHLVDSAQNNIRRFILSQYQEHSQVVYDQDRWVSLNNYQEWELKDLAGLWELLNRQICLLLQNPSM